MVALLLPTSSYAQSPEAMEARDRLRACAEAQDPHCFMEEALESELAWYDQAFIAARLAENGRREIAHTMMMEALDAEVALGLEIRPHYIGFVMARIVRIANYARRTSLYDVGRNARLNLLRLSILHEADQRGDITTCGPGEEDNRRFIISLSGPSIEIAAWAAREEMRSHNYPRGYSAVQFVAGTALYAHESSEWDSAVHVVLDLFRDTGLHEDAGRFLESFLPIYAAHFVGCDMSTELVSIYAPHRDLFSPAARQILINQLIEYGSAHPLEPFGIAEDYYYPRRKYAWLEIDDLLRESAELHEIYADSINAIRVDGSQLPMPHPTERDLIELVAPGHDPDINANDVIDLIDDDPPRFD